MTPVALPAGQAPEPTTEHADVPGPVLPLVVVAVPLGEDDLQLEGVALPRDLPPRESVVDRARTEVAMHQLTGVDDVVDPIRGELVLRQQVALDRAHEHGVVLLRVEQLLERGHQYPGGRRTILFLRFCRCLLFSTSRRRRRS